MRELDTHVTSCAIVGAGRLGSALSAALCRAGVDVAGPLSRKELPPAGVPVLLCVPDSEIASAARALPVGAPAGHCSGATTLGPLLDAGHEAFSLHPLMTVPPGGNAAFAGAGCAVAGSTPHALALARGLGERLGMETVEVSDSDRAVYHAAAAIASNFLTTLEGAAERLAAEAGVGRSALVPLVRASVENWATLGAREALTGPIARGDEATVERHRAALAERAPDLLPLYDALADATRLLAGRAVTA
jgi:predicted short-subunit dehydrogenase-like oxidoreductase (DUF2520 family)